MDREEKRNAVMSYQDQKRNVYVVGHRNPDTDSICSAIAYADLKNRMEQPMLIQSDNQYCFKAARAGQLNPETLYVLKRFGVPVPTYLNNIGTRVKDMEIRHVDGIDQEISLKKAYEIMNEEGVVTLPVTTSDNDLIGLITINDIATSYMKKQENTVLSEARTPYKNILETLDGSMIVGDPDASITKGKVIIAASNPDVMEKYIEPGDVVILGNRYEMQFSAIESGAGCIIVCLNIEVPNSIRHFAESKNCTIIETPLDTYEVARLINQSMPARQFMTSKNLITFNRSDYLEKVSEIMKNKRIRDFPVLNSEGKYAGMISRRNLLGARKRAVILVDHNEISQAIDNIREADILEVIDHHRLGSLETMNPVYFRNEPVGCTATIVELMYREHNIVPTKTSAGLMMAAILSDTLLFRSPTCTIMDKMAAERLARIAEVDLYQFAEDMFKAGSDLSHKSPEELFYQDYKKFEFGELEFGVSQITTMNSTELEQMQDALLEYMDRIRHEQRMHMMYCMLTDIPGESTLLLYCGENAEKTLRTAFPGHEPTPNEEQENWGTIRIPGMVSRKKQLIPAFLDVFHKE